MGGSTITNHAFGLAIDVNYRGNPYIGRAGETDRRRNVPDRQFTADEIIARATRLMLGREIRIRGGQAGTLEEIRARYEEASDALVDYFELRDDWHGVVEALAARDLDTGDENVAQHLAQIQNDFDNPNLRADLETQDPNNPRDPMAGFIDLSADLVEALGNRARLYWGGQYQGGKDMMHFDWRGGTVRTRHREALAE